jgi:cytochrome-b5 reductase
MELSTFLEENLVQVIVAVIVILLLGALLFRPKQPMKTVKSFADISKGLQKELNQENGSKSAFSNDERVLSASVFRKFPILKIVQTSYNTKLLRFELPAGKSLGLTIGKHITLKADLDGAKVMRAYTPTSRIDQVGFFDLLIKTYEYGKMSSYINQLKVGDYVEVRGPVGRFQYQVNQYSSIGLIAGGTGITPCLQVLRTILYCPSYKDDITQFVLFFQNRTEQDILLYDELEKIRKEHGKRVKIYYFLSNPNPEEHSSSFGQGARASVEIRHAIQTSDLHHELSLSTSLIGICGPSGFNDAMKAKLLQLGHTEESIFLW